MVAQQTLPRLKSKYRESVVPAMQEQFSYKNVMEVPKLDKIVVSILDNGPGIPSEHAERLLRPFERMDSARNKYEGGSGLGLAICNRIAKLHGGQLSLLNRPEGGLRAEIRLPLP